MVPRCAAPRARNAARSAARCTCRWRGLTPHALRQLTEEERSAALAELQRRETEYTRLRRQKLTVEDFAPLTIIGRGAFGEVRLLRRRRGCRGHTTLTVCATHLAALRACTRSASCASEPPATSLQ